MQPKNPYLYHIATALKNVPKHIPYYVKYSADVLYSTMQSNRTITWKKCKSMSSISKSLSGNNGLEKIAAMPR